MGEHGKVAMRPLWCKEACWQCGMEGYATRTQQTPKSEPYICSDCRIDERAYERGLADGRAAERKSVIDYALKRNYGDTCRTFVKHIARGYHEHAEPALSGGDGGGEVG